jgi:hypothetical protein
LVTHVFGRVALIKATALSLIVNAICAVTFLFSVYALMVRVGYAPDVSFMRWSAAGVVVDSAFWITAGMSWPLSLLALWLSHAVAGAAPRLQSSSAIILAWFEVAAWALIWVGFGVVFADAFICGLRY